MCVRLYVARVLKCLMFKTFTIVLRCSIHFFHWLKFKPVALKGQFTPKWKFRLRTLMLNTKRDRMRNVPVPIHFHMDIKDAMQINGDRVCHFARHFISWIQTARW